MISKEVYVGYHYSRGITKLLRTENSEKINPFFGSAMSGLW